MAHQAEMQKSYKTAISYFVEKVRAIDGAGLRLSLKCENPAEDGSVWFRVLHGMTAASYGEKITITLKPTEDGTNVHILSVCGMPTQIMDMGKNKSNCEAIFKYLEQGIESAPAASPAPAPAAEPAPAPAADPSPYPVAQPDIFPLEHPEDGPAPETKRTHIYCAQCGTKNEITSKFCFQCGSRLIF